MGDTSNHVDDEKVLDLAKRASGIVESVRSETEGVVHYSAPIIEAQYAGGDGATVELELDLRDVLAMCAMARVNVLLPGETRVGKTFTVRKVSAALFGEYNVTYIPLNAGFDINQLRNINFSKMKDSTLSEGVRPGRALTGPAVIFDELNRAPPPVTNLLHPLLNGDPVVFDGGKTVIPGVELPEGGRYQWVVAIANIGRGYLGTFEMDLAALNRFPVVIPIDNFPRTDDDRLKIMRSAESRGRGNGGDHARDVYSIGGEAKSLLRMDPMAENFLLRLLRQNQCTRSPAGMKNVLDSFSVSETCKSCHALAVDEGICGSVFAPGEGAIAKLADLSRMFALLRISSEAEPELRAELRVTVGDVKAVMPLALHLKMGVDGGWISRYAEGSSWNATQKASNLAFAGWLDSMEKLQSAYNEAEEGKPLSDASVSALLNVARDRPSCVPIEYVKRVHEEYQQDGGAKSGKAKKCD
jgi:MoxR-like ATPase